MYDKPLSGEQGILMVNGMPLATKVNVSPNAKIPDGPRTLWELAGLLERKELEPPPHQRSPDAWDDKKKKAWIDRCNSVLSGDEPPLGTVCIYQLRNSGAKEYLNEGLQRISAAREAKLSPETYGYTPEEIEKILKVTWLLVQNRIYRDHPKAAEDYIAVNNGTVLQPIEQNKAAYVYHPKWPIWEPALEEWHNELGKSLAEFSSSPERRHAKLNRERHEKQIFCMACIKRPTNYGRDNELELAVAECLGKEEPHKIKDFIRKVRNYSAEICNAWRESDPERHHAVKMDGSVARWCLGVRFYYDDIKPDWWQSFFAKLFKRTGGSAIFSYASEQGKAKTKTLVTRLDHFRGVCKELSVEVPEQVQRTRSPIRLSPGWQADHIEPFSDFGDGEIQPLPATLNAAKNARRPTQV